MAQPGRVALEEDLDKEALEVREIKRRYLEESKCEIIEFLLLAESDQQLLAELRVEEDLLLLEGELLLARLAQHGVAQGGDVVADVVNTSLL